VSPRLIAVDWSGAHNPRDQRKKIWLGEVQDGVLVRLEDGRDRDELAEHLVDEAARDPALVVGLDFAFSLPAWFLADRGLGSAYELWELAAREGEHWLHACEPPFWGRPGVARPPGPEQFRRTERRVGAVAGVRPKPVFQIGGAGAVGTASVRGMPALKRLRDAGFHVWPFDPPALPLVVEIYPRLLTGPVTKSDFAGRCEYLSARFPHLAVGLGVLAMRSDDAFDAAVSALVMSEHAAELLRLAPIRDPRMALEGEIWRPRLPVFA